MTDREELIYLRRLAFVNCELYDRADVSKRFPQIPLDAGRMAAWLRDHGWKQTPLGLWELHTTNGLVESRFEPLYDPVATAILVAERMGRLAAEVIAEMLAPDGPWDQAYAPSRGYARL